jgi:hypothetical protein
MLLTTNWSEPTLSSRVPSFKSMRHLFDCGMSPTCVSYLDERFGPGRSHSSTQYAQPVTKKGSKAAAAEEKKDGEEKKLSNHAQRSLAERRKGTHRFFLLVWLPELIWRIAGVQTPRSIRYLKRSSEQVAFMLRSRAGRDKLAGLMDISSKGKSSR